MRRLVAHSQNSTMWRRLPALCRRCSAASDSWPEHPGGVLLLLFLGFLPLRMLSHFLAHAVTVSALVCWLGMQLMLSFHPTICRSFGSLAVALIVFATVLSPIDNHLPAPSRLHKEGPYYELELCANGTKRSFKAFSLRRDSGEEGTACPVLTQGVSASASATVAIKLSTPASIEPSAAYRLVLLMATGSYARATFTVSDASGAVLLPNASFEVGPDDLVPWAEEAGGGAAAAGPAVAPANAADAAAASLTATAAAASFTATASSAASAASAASAITNAAASSTAASAAAASAAAASPASAAASSATFDASSRRLSSRPGRRLKGGSIGHIGSIGGSVGARAGTGSFTSPFRRSSASSSAVGRSSGGAIPHGVPLAHGVPVAQGRLAGAGGYSGHHAFGRPGGGVGGYNGIGGVGGVGYHRQYYSPHFASDIATGFAVAHVLRMPHHHEHHHHAGYYVAAGGGSSRHGGTSAADGAATSFDANGGAPNGAPAAGPAAGAFFHGPQALRAGRTVSTLARGHAAMRALASDYDRYVLLEPLLLTPPATGEAPTGDTALGTGAHHGAPKAKAAHWPLTLRVHSLSFYSPLSSTDASGGPPVPLLGRCWPQSCRAHRPDRR